MITVTLVAGWLGFVVDTDPLTAKGYGVVSLNVAVSMVTEYVIGCFLLVIADSQSAGTDDNRTGIRGGAQPDTPM
ncbi:MAG TPA: hypothetical protein DEA26_08800 [Oceanospirillales bacterium]|nr:hypothetical protein [Oceanospirillaceae bacterium]HBS42764.1 hypothetical protein [Oceanospirillales bacterium]|tara:strand:- start:9394 stop:9618 length:225 start_codon:yes stop_codon:yes gene_type:complete